MFAVGVKQMHADHVAHFLAALAGFDGVPALTPLGGELHRLSPGDAERIIRLPFSTPETTTALTSAPSPVLAEPSPEAKAALEDVAKQFTVDKKGQGDFGF